MEESLTSPSPEETAEENKESFNEVARARALLRDFVTEEKSRERKSGHFLPGITMKEEFNDSDIPDEEVLIFPKARDHVLTPEEFEAYRKPLLNERGVLKEGVNSSRHALLQYVNNMYGVSQLREELKKLSQK